MGKVYKHQNWSLRAGGQIADRPPVQGPSLIPAGKTGSFNPRDDDPDKDFPVYYCRENAFNPVPPTASPGPIRFATKNSLLRLPKVLLYDAVYFDFGDRCNDATTRHHFENMKQNLADGLADSGVEVYTGSYFADPSVVRTDGSGFVGGDVYLLVVSNRMPFSVTGVPQITVDRYDRVFDNPLAPDNNYTDSFAGKQTQPGVGIANSVFDYPQWVKAVSHFRNFHGLVAVAPVQRFTVIPPTRLPPDISDLPPVDTCPIEAQLIFYTIPPSAVLHWYYDLPDYDARDAQNLAAAQDFVAAFNGSAPTMRGDCTWEVAQVPADQDVSAFVSRVKAWLGVA